MNFKFHIPTKVFFGRGELSKLHRRELPGKKALIVTSAGTSVRSAADPKMTDGSSNASANSIVRDFFMPLSMVWRHLCKTIPHPSTIISP